MTGTSPAQQGPAATETRWPSGLTRKEAATWLPRSAAPDLSPGTGSVATNRGSRAQQGSAQLRACWSHLGSPAPLATQRPVGASAGPALLPADWDPCEFLSTSVTPPNWVGEGETPHLLKINRTHGDLVLKGHFPRRPRDSASPKARSHPAWPCLPGTERADPGEHLGPLGSVTAPTQGRTAVRFPNTCLPGGASPFPEWPAPPPGPSHCTAGRISRKKTRGCLEAEAPWGMVAGQGLGFSPRSLWTQLLDTTPASTRKALYAAGPNQM